MAKIKKILKIAGITLAALILIPLLIGQVLRLISSVEPPAGQLVDVGGYKLHINCISPKGKSGDELPTVIIEAGAGVASPLYHWLQQGVAEKTKVCVYDRAGLGWSEESNLPRDSKSVTTALHTLLDKAEVRRPFVFAGHSIAGLYMRDYVERYPEDVAGLVFLDASHPRQMERFGFSDEQQATLQATVESQISMAKLLIGLGVMEVYNPIVESSEDFKQLPENIRNQIAYLSKQTSGLDTALLETNDFKKAGEQADKNKTLGDRPIVVISATKEWAPGVWPEGFDLKKIQATFLTLHKEIAALSTESEHVEIDTADHMGLVTNKENVDKVVPYIIKVVDASAKTARAKPDQVSEKSKAEVK
jgi:pimeloyl-ACP methyl ester carboxylesterase